MRMRAGWNIDTATFAQALWIRKGDASETRPKTAWINAQDDVALQIVIIIFCVKCFTGCQGAFILTKWIHDANSMWQRSSKLKPEIKANHFLAKSKAILHFRSKGYKEFALAKRYKTYQIWRTIIIILLQRRKIAPFWMTWPPVGAI